MIFLDLVKKRQSVRKYAPRPVPRDAIERCLEAARLAPSACNSQLWSFIILDDEKLRDEVAEKAFSGACKMNSFAKNAQVLVVAVTERSTYFARLGGFFRGTQYNLIDIGIACEHFALQAAEEGIGTCFLGIFNEKAVKKALRIPRGKKVDVIISMGYPAIEQTREKVRKPLGEMRKFTS